MITQYFLFSNTSRIWSKILNPREMVPFPGCFSARWCSFRSCQPRSLRLGIRSCQQESGFHAGDILWEHDCLTNMGIYRMNYICCNYDIWMCLKMVQTIPMYSPIFPANSISSVQLSSSPCLLDIFPLSMGDNVVVPVGIYSHYIYII